MSFTPRSPNVLRGKAGPILAVAPADVEAPDTNECGRAIGSLPVFPQVDAEATFGAGSFLTNLYGVGLSRDGETIYTACPVSETGDTPATNFVQSSIGLIGSPVPELSDHMVVHRHPFDLIGDHTAGDNIPVAVSYASATTEMVSFGGGSVQAVQYFTSCPLSNAVFDWDGRMYMWTAYGINVTADAPPPHTNFDSGTIHTCLASSVTLKLQRYELVGGAYVPVADLMTVTNAPSFGTDLDHAFFNSDPAIGMWILGWNPYDDRLYTVQYRAGWTRRADNNEPFFVAGDHSSTLYRVNPRQGNPSDLANVPTPVVNANVEAPPPVGPFWGGFAFTTDGAAWIPVNVNDGVDPTLSFFALGRYLDRWEVSYPPGGALSPYQNFEEDGEGSLSSIPLPLKSESVDVSVVPTPRTGRGDGDLDSLMAVSARGVWEIASCPSPGFPKPKLGSATARVSGAKRTLWANEYGNYWSARDGTIHYFATGPIPVAAVSVETHTQRFEAADRPQFFTVPTHIGLVHVTAKGPGVSAAFGAQVDGDLDLVEGDIWRVHVGGQPQGNVGGWNGGGNGGGSFVSTTGREFAASGGCGATDLRSTEELEFRVLVAGGAGAPRNQFFGDSVNGGTPDSAAASIPESGGGATQGGPGVRGESVYGGEAGDEGAFARGGSGAAGLDAALLTSAENSGSLGPATVVVGLGTYVSGPRDIHEILLQPYGKVMVRFTAATGDFVTGDAHLGTTVGSPTVFDLGAVNSGFSFPTGWATYVNNSLDPLSIYLWMYGAFSDITYTVEIVTFSQVVDPGGGGGGGYWGGGGGASSVDRQVDPQNRWGGDGGGGSSWASPDLVHNVTYTVDDSPFDLLHDKAGSLEITWYTPLSVTPDRGVAVIIGQTRRLGTYAPSLIRGVM